MLHFLFFPILYGGQWLWHFKCWRGLLWVTISHSFLLWCFYHPLEMKASHFNPALLWSFPLCSTTAHPLVQLSEYFPLLYFPFSPFLSVLFCCCFFLRIIHSYLSSQSPFRQQPLIFLMLVCYIKVSKRVVREPVSSVIYDYCSSSGITGRTEQNTKISRETKANVKCHKPLVSKGSLQ